MGAAVYLLAHWMTGRFNAVYSRKINAAIVFTCMAAGAVIYAALLPLFRVNEAKTFMDMIKRRLSRARTTG